MLKSSDLIHLSFTPDLTQAGIAYVCRSLPRLRSWASPSSLRLLHNYVADKAVELAFRRHLVSEKIPHGNLCATPLSDPDQYDILMGGHRCLVRSNHVFERKEIRNLRRDPACLLQLSAAISVNELIGEAFDDTIIYIFALSTALIAIHRADQERAQSTGQPFYWIHIPPKNWNVPHRWASLGTILLKSDATKTILVELGGYDSDNTFHSEQISLQPHSQVEVQGVFHSLAYIHVEPIPDGRIGLRSPMINHPYLISPNRWDNLWVYGMDIILAGYSLRQEIHQRSMHQPKLPYSLNRALSRNTSTDSRFLMYPISNLHPLTDLFDRIQDWSHKNLK
jgi:hypothetical protein